MNDRPTHIDLFSGIGGFALASRWAGFRTIAFCEKDEWCQKVLAKNFGAEVMADASIKRCRETREHCERSEERIASSREVLADSEGGKSRQSPEHEGREDTGGGSEKIPLYPDIKTFPGHLYRGATLLTGGFPCQPFSCAGKQQGTADDRDLWPFMFDVIKDARPTWIIGENVAGFVKMELDRSISDLESEGYSVRTFIIPACATDAKHRRDRCWIVAHNNAIRCDMRGLEGQGIYGNEQTRSEVVTGNQDVAQSNFQHGRPGTGRQDGEKAGDSCVWPDENEWFAQSGEGRVASGESMRVDRLKGLGNAIVPQVAYEIMRMIPALTSPKTPSQNHHLHVFLGSGSAGGSSGGGGAADGNCSCSCRL